MVDGERRAEAGGRNVVRLAGRWQRRVLLSWRFSCYKVATSSIVCSVQRAFFFFAIRLVDSVVQWHEAVAMPECASYGS